MQLHHEYDTCLSVSDALGCRSEMCLNDYDTPAEGAAGRRKSEPGSHILTQELDYRVDCVDCAMRLAIMQ